MPVRAMGKHNPRLRQIRQALREGSLTPDGFLPVEGHHSLEEARSSGLEVAEILLSESAREREKPDSTPGCYVLSDDVFRTVSTQPGPQGVMALVRPPRFALDELFSVVEPPPLVILLSRVQDPGNAGTILRLAEAFGASGCAATPGTVGIYNPKLVRASAGSLFRVPHVWSISIDVFFKKAHDLGAAIVATASDGSTAIDEYDWSGPTALLVGNEGGGVSPGDRARCDTVVRIPHRGTVESLNAATATAVLLYECQRQRLGADR